MMTSSSSSSTTTALAVAGSCLALVTAWKLVGRLPSSSKTGRRVSQRQLWWARRLQVAYWLTHVRIPLANLPAANVEDDDQLVVSQEGWVDCHVHVDASGTIGKILVAKQSSGGLPPPPPPRSIRSWQIHGHSALVVPCFVDAHTHMIKTQTVPRNPNFTGTITEALAAEDADVAQWWGGSDSSLHRQMDFSVRCARAHGTRAMRTHLDGCAALDESVREAVWQAFTSVQEKYAGEIILQGVANLWLPLWLLPMATEHADRAAAHTNVVLGAYVGNPSDEEKPETLKAMKVLFGHAQRVGLDVDMHIDESNDPACCALLTLCQALAAARQAGYTGQVVLGHCCALSLQAKKVQSSICRQLASLEAYVVANPTTNLGLQDRSGSARPHSFPIDKDVPRTPQWRGLTLVQELRAAKVVVAAASDNVRDHWHPYADYDLLAVWYQVQAMGHLDTAPHAGAWADLCTDAAAQAMGLLTDGAVSTLLHEGAPADLVIFPSARLFSELFSRPQSDRLILRQGQLQDYVLPDFCELDDVVAVRTVR
jgi:cytosine deaminase